VRRLGHEQGPTKLILLLICLSINKFSNALNIVIYTTTLEFGTKVAENSRPLEERVLMWLAAYGWAMIVQEKDCEGQERTVEVTEQGGRRRSDREPVLDADDGDSQPVVPEGRVSYAQGHAFYRRLDRPSSTAACNRKAEI